MVSYTSRNDLFNTPMKVNLHMTMLYVQDVTALRKFYKDLFNMQVIEESPGWVVLQAGDGRIGLHQIGEQYKEDKPFKFDSNCKLVFDISEDLKAERSRLIAAGVNMRELKTFDNYDYWVCDGEDPEGNVFQLRQRKVA